MLFTLYKKINLQILYCIYVVNVVYRITVDGVALAASKFVKFTPFFTKNSHGHEWQGEVTITESVFRVITRPAYFRRVLHFDNPSKGGNRKRKGVTVTPFGYLKSDYVEAEKAGIKYRGWMGGFTNTEKSKKLSVYNLNWKRIGQFSLSKIKLLRRSNKLCIGGQDFWGFPRSLICPS